MRNVSRLSLAEAVRVDRDRIEALVIDHGTQGAERLMGRALEALAVRLNRAERAWCRDQPTALCREAEAVGRVAGEVGLVGLAQAARAVTSLAMTGDNAAISTTVARMMRVGEASLMSAWELDDRSL